MRSSDGHAGRFPRKASGNAGGHFGPAAASRSELPRADGDTDAFVDVFAPRAAEFLRETGAGRARPAGKGRVSANRRGRSALALRLQRVRTIPERALADAGAINHHFHAAIAFASCGSGVGGERPGIAVSVGSYGAGRGSASDESLAYGLRVLARERLGVGITFNANLQPGMRSNDASNSRQAPGVFVPQPVASECNH